MGLDDRQRKRLFDMEFDEISVVDNGANQHAAIVFAKAHDPEEDDMPGLELEEIDVYDADGRLVDSIEHGDVVFDEDGNEYVYVDDEYLDDTDYSEVGKALIPKGAFSNSPMERFRIGFGQGREVAREARHAKKLGPEAGLPPSTVRAARQMANTAQEGEFGRLGRLGQHVGVHRNKYLAGGAGVGAAGAGYGGYEYNKRRVKKSLGDVVMEELSKAATEDERSEIIAKAMEEVEIAKEQANEAWERVASQEDAMLENAFISKAAEYNLPVDPSELGPILKAASTVLDYDQLDLLDRLFNGVGEALYEEIGYVGDTDNASVLDQVNGYVDELVGKSDYSAEELSTAVFEANPAAYDEYLSENRW